LTDVNAAVAALGDGPLTEARVQRHVAPLFSRVLEQWRGRIYLANHSLGRPLDATESDVREGLAAWYAHMGGAWDAWLDEMRAYRTRLARLMGAARFDCVVPKASAGQGLRAILNTYDTVPHVLATRGEFDSLDLILREYARRGRIALTLLDPDDVLGALDAPVDLVVVSHVMFNTGARVSNLDEIVARTHRGGGLVMLDLYHSLGVIPVDVAEMDVDFAVGGSYKYLRGGPGACFLYVAPPHLDGRLRTLDTGWFAKRDPFAYLRPDPPVLAEGGDAFLESTPAVLPIYQARAGQLLMLALRVDRVRAYSLALQQTLVALLAQRGVAAQGGTDDRGAFVIVTHPQAEAWSDALAVAEVVTDARGPYLRLCPDLLTTEAEIVAAADAVVATRPRS